MERLRPLPDWGIKRLPRLVSAIRRWRPDIVHLQFPAQGYRATLLPSLVPLIAWASGSKVVRTWHEPILHAGAGWRAWLATALQLPVPGPIIVVRPNYRALLPAWLAKLLSRRRLHFVAGASAIPVSQLEPAALRRLHDETVGAQQRLIVFFGFLYPHKGVEQLFDIADPATDHLVLVGGSDSDSAYARMLAARAATAPWTGKVTFAGYLEPAAIADLLAAADAVVLPYRDGGGIWNSSLHAALAQGSFTIATTTAPTGFDPDRNLYLAAIDDRAQMGAALNQHAGTSRSERRRAQGSDWDRVAREHLAVYGQ